MRQSIGQRLLLMVYTAVWLVLLMAVYWALVEQASSRIERMYTGMSLPKITRHVALPLIGGLRPTKGFNALPYLVWGGLFIWPMINVVLIWSCHDPSRMRHGLFYSCIGYGLCFFAVTIAIVAGLALPFWRT